MKLHYKSFGSGSPIIILHGIFGMGDNWTSIAKKLADDNLVILPDMRNHGRSEHSSTFNLEVTAEDLKELMIELSLEKAVIVGHSMGGKIAMTFALKYPEQCSELIIIDIAPRQYTRGHDTIFAALRNTDIQLTNDRSEIEHALLKLIPEISTVQFLMKSLARNAAGNGFYWRFNLQSLYENYDNIIMPINTNKVYSGPVLFIRGADSNYISEADKETILNLFPTAKMITVKNAGHWVHADQPELITRILAHRN